VDVEVTEAGIQQPPAEQCFGDFHAHPNLKRLGKMQQLPACDVHAV